MQGFTILGKALILSFWLLPAAAVGNWLGSPFAQLAYLLGAFMLGLHGLQLWLFAGLLGGRPSPWLDRAQILLFGIFHLFSLKASGQAVDQRITVQEAAHA